MDSAAADLLKGRIFSPDVKWSESSTRPVVRNRLIHDACFLRCNNHMSLFRYQPTLLLMCCDDQNSRNHLLMFLI